MTVFGACKLCERVGALRESHLIPKFVFRWMNETSPGYLRDGQNPNRRIQDGPKRPWLCGECEALFNKAETPFASQVFKYVHEASGNQSPIEYGPWAMYFAASVSWRSLLLTEETGTEHLSQADQSALAKARQAWREYLLGRRRNPGEFQQHVVFVDALASETSSDVSPFLNRYFLRTVHLDLVVSRHACFTYVKVGRIIVIGFIRVEKPKQWSGTRLNVSGGYLGKARANHLPPLLLHYWNDKATQLGRSQATMSPAQRSKVAGVFRDTPPDDLAQTEAFRAMCADVELSGQRAFEITADESRDLGTKR